jgi:FkbM family methyltransferase
MRHRCSKPIREHSTDPCQIDQRLRSFRGGLAFDIGANCGQAARLMAPNFKQIVSFEPCFESWVIAHEEAPPNVTVHNLAISSSSGSIELWEQETHISRGQLTSPTHPNQECTHGWGKKIGKRKVPAVTVDRQVAVMLRAPDFIKCDVEGHELEVFKGSLSTLETARPRLLIEVHLEELGQDLIILLHKFYDNIEIIRHPNYKFCDWGYANHYWLIAQ